MLSSKRAASVDENTPLQAADARSGVISSENRRPHWKKRATIGACALATLGVAAFARSNWNETLGMAPVYSVTGSATFTVDVGCVDASVRSQNANFFSYGAQIVGAKLVRHNLDSKEFFEYEDAISMTLSHEDAYQKQFTVTTDEVDFEYGFALVNSRGDHLYEIGADSAPLREQWHRLERDPEHDNCVQKYGDFYNRVRTMDKSPTTVTFRWGSCEAQCEPPSPPPPSPPSPSPPSPPAPPATPLVADRCIADPSPPELASSPFTISASSTSTAAYETFGTSQADWIFDHQGLYKIQATRTLGSTDVYFANTVSNLPEDMCMANYRRTTSMSYTSKGIQINAQNTPRDKNQEWGTNELANSRVDVLKTSSFASNGPKLGAGIELVGSRSGQSTVEISHDFGTTDYIVFAMVMNAGANNAFASYAISDGFHAHVYDQTSTGFKVHFGRHTKTQGWGNSAYTIHWIAFRKTRSSSTSPGTIAIANNVAIPDETYYESGKYTTLCVEHNLGTTNYKCYATVVANSNTADWITSGNSLFVAECEIAANYVYFSTAYTGYSMTQPISSGNVDYSKLSINYMLVRV